MRAFLKWAIEHCLSFCPSWSWLPQQRNYNTCRWVLESIYPGLSSCNHSYKNCTMSHSWKYVAWHSTNLVLIQYIYMHREHSAFDHFHFRTLQGECLTESHSQAQFKQEKNQVSHGYTIISLSLFYLQFGMPYHIQKHYRLHISYNVKA